MKVKGTPPTSEQTESDLRTQGSSSVYDSARDKMEAPLLENPKNANAITRLSVTTSTSDHDVHHRTPSKPLEQVFLTMHYRKMQRDLNGPQKKKRKYHFVALACLLILLYGLGAYSHEGEESLVISLNIQQISIIGVWVFLSIIITSIFGNSKFVVLMYWMLVYWPLLAVLAQLLFHGEKRIIGSGSVSDWITYGFIIAEVLTPIMFIVANYLYPKLVTSRWFRETYGATRFWRIHMIDASTTTEQRSLFAMEYDGVWGKLSRRYQCRYVGEVNDEGLPHGQGIWSDDSYDGEVLTGTWENGEPVAPYSSRQYGGRGDTFSAIRLAFFMANDDKWEANRLVPSNDGPPRCGVASVECSIAGDFMSHLPAATLVGGSELQVEGNDDLTIGSCCMMLDNGSSHSETPVTSLRIDSRDLRGVQIGGHLYAPTGLPFTRRIKEIIINITRSDITEAYIGNDEEDAMNEEEEGGRTTALERTTDYDSMRLEVKNWMKVETKDALIFIPGFNSWLQHSLETFGQMMAMTKMGRNVYPVLFAWPGGQVPTYRQASFISASENNRNYFLQMLRGLQSEGIQNIHIVSHSLGVQTLMSVFEDNSDGSPSLVSQCFGPAPTNGDSPGSALELGKLVCRSITMLNPDFPVYAFRETGFRSLRRVSSLITVVGDKADQALFWSSLINGICNSLSYSQPSACDSKARIEESGFHLQQPIGRNVDSLYVEDGTNLGSERMVLQHGASIIHSPKRETGAAAKIWLDCDVIDTTGLDTNVNDLRHSAYNVNSILLRDIEELIVTGKRASERTTLLHKKGNVYEYCHAPSFVKM